VERVTGRVAGACVRSRRGSRERVGGVVFGGVGLGVHRSGGVRSRRACGGAEGGGDSRLSARIAWHIAWRIARRVACRRQRGGGIWIVESIEGRRMWIDAWPRGGGWSRTSRVRLRHRPRGSTPNLIAHPGPHTGAESHGAAFARRTWSIPRERDPRALEEGKQLFRVVQLRRLPRRDRARAGLGPSLQDGRWHFRGQRAGEIYESDQRKGGRTVCRPGAAGSVTPRSGHW